GFDQDFAIEQDDPLLLWWLVPIVVVRSVRLAKDHLMSGLRLAQSTDRAGVTQRNVEVAEMGNAVFVGDDAGDFHVEEGGKRGRGGCDPPKLRFERADASVGAIEVRMRFACSGPGSRRPFPERAPGVWPGPGRPTSHQHRRSGASRSRRGESAETPCHCWPRRRRSGVPE